METRLVIESEPFDDWILDLVNVMNKQPGIKIRQPNVFVLDIEQQQLAEAIERIMVAANRKCIKLPVEDPKPGVWATLKFNGQAGALLATPADGEVEPDPETLGPSVYYGVGLDQDEEGDLPAFSFQQTQWISNHPAQQVEDEDLVVTDGIKTHLCHNCHREYTPRRRDQIYCTDKDCKADRQKKYQEERKAQLRGVRLGDPSEQETPGQAESMVVDQVAAALAAPAVLVEEYKPSRYEVYEIVDGPLYKGSRWLSEYQVSSALAFGDLVIGQTIRHKNGKTLKVQQGSMKHQKLQPVANNEAA